MQLIHFVAQVSGNSLFSWKQRSEEKKLTWRVIGCEADEKEDKKEDKKEREINYNCAIAD